jgi:hypothetical protein
MAGGRAGNRRQDRRRYLPVDLDKTRGRADYRAARRDYAAFLFVMVSETSQNIKAGNMVARDSALWVRDMKVAPGLLPQPGHAAAAAFSQGGNGRDCRRVSP